MPILPSVVNKEKIIYTLTAQVSNMCHANPPLSCEQRKIIYTLTAQVSNMCHANPANPPPQSTTQVNNMCPAEPSSSPHSPQLPPPGV